MLTGTTRTNLALARHCLHSHSPPTQRLHTGEAAPDLIRNTQPYRRFFHPSGVPYTNCIFHLFCSFPTPCPSLTQRPFFTQYTTAHPIDFHLITGHAVLNHAGSSLPHRLAPARSGAQQLPGPRQRGQSRRQSCLRWLAQGLWRPVAAHGCEKVRGGLVRDGLHKRSFAGACGAYAGVLCARALQAPVACTCSHARALQQLSRAV